MASRSAKKKRAAGGKAGAEYDYNAKGSKEESEAHETADNFKKGGAKKKDGGQVSGMKSGGRLDKRARGGGVRKGSNHSPYSSAKGGSGRTDSTGDSAGHMGTMPSQVDEG